MRETRPSLWVPAFLDAENITMSHSMTDGAVFVSVPSAAAQRCTACRRIRPDGKLDGRQARPEEPAAWKGVEMHAVKGRIVVVL